MADEEARLNRLLTDIQVKEKRAYRRAAMYTAISVIVGLLLLAYSFYTVRGLRRTAAELDKEIEIKRGELANTNTQLSQTRETLDQARQNLDAATKTLNDYAENKVPPAKQAEVARQTLAKIAENNRSKPSVQVPREVVTNTGPPPPTPQPQEQSRGGRWIVVAGGDKTEDAARERMKKVQSLGYANVYICFRDNFRTVIEFSSKSEADAKLPAIRRSISSDAYVRDLNAWCPQCKCQR